MVADLIDLLGTKTNFLVPLVGVVCLSVSKSKMLRSSIVMDGENVLFSCEYDEFDDSVVSKRDCVVVSTVVLFEDDDSEDSLFIKKGDKDEIEGDKDSVCGVVKSITLLLL